MVLKVTRDGIPDSDDVADSALSDMPNEEWDRVVQNDGDLSALSDVARELAWMIRERLDAGGDEHGTAGLPA